MDQNDLEGNELTLFFPQELGGGMPLPLGESASVLRLPGFLTEVWLMLDP